ncbi:MAG: hypothetical protein DRQ51_09545 [Gammaproteobacteria bacterium]|nr:MAG: hypothetical protein DRQ51_09545 [Gammaproteobacteria bacterium]
MKTKLFIFPVILLFYANSAFAYLDPGSGSMLVYFLIGIFATAIYSIKNQYLKIKIGLIRLFSKNKVKLNHKKNIVFYSEGGHYWSSFQGVIKEICKMGYECSYYTSDKNDEGLLYKNKFYDSQFIGDDRLSVMALNYLNAKIVIMTTPQLDVMYLKRSDNVQYYIHLIHAPTDVFNYHPFAFDFFDCVMCSGPHQIKHLRQIEQARNMPEKKLLKTGLVYYDELSKEKNKISKKTNQKTTILIAPTWGDIGLLNKTGFLPIKILLENDYNVILRSHPQSYINDKTLMEEIEKKAKNHINLKIDKTPSAKESMSKADIMISDVSGIIFDFAFVYEKPVIAFAGILETCKLAELNLVNSNNKNTAKIWELEIMDKIADIVDIKDIQNLPSLIKKSLKKDYKQSIKRLRGESIFNYRKAGKVAALQIIDIYKNIHA